MREAQVIHIMLEKMKKRSWSSWKTHPDSIRNLTIWTTVYTPLKHRFHASAQIPKHEPALAAWARQREA